MTSPTCSRGRTCCCVTEVYAAGEAPIAGADGRAICRAVRSRGQLEPVFVEQVEELAAALEGRAPRRRRHRHHGRGQHQRGRARAADGARGAAAAGEAPREPRAGPGIRARACAATSPCAGHTSWHVGGPAEVFFTPRDRADLAAFLRSAARRGAHPLGRPRQQPAGARRRHPRRGHLAPTARSMRSSARRRDHGARRGRRRLRAHRAAVRQVGPGAGGVLRRHPRHARRRAGDERRRLRRGDLAARARASRPSTARASARTRGAPSTEVGYRHVQRARRRGMVPGRGPELRAHARRARGRGAHAAGAAQGQRSRSGSGAAARCSPTRPAIMPRA